MLNNTKVLRGVGDFLALSSALLTIHLQVKEADAGR